MDTRGCETRLVRLPVRARRTVASSGESAVEALIFCRRLARSVPLELCVHCTRCRRVEGSGAAVDCDNEPPRDDDSPRVDVGEVAARTFVGEIASREPVCVREDVSANLVLSLLHANRRCVPVVTERGVLVGIVCPGVLFRVHRGEGEAPSARALARRVEPLTEDMALSIAVGVMAESGEPELPVVSAAGALTGLLGTADVVAWMAARMGYAPSGAPGASTA